MTTHDPLKLARDALQKLACLGNGDKPGNSTGNVIALTTLAAIDALPSAPAWPCHCDERGIGKPGVTCGDCPRDYGHTVDSAPSGEPADTLRQRLQQQCTDWGTYWRASDAHGVDLTHEQALELLRDALGVEVAIAAPLPARHVGESKFESWFSEYRPGSSGDKQRMRDAYAAGMSDPGAAPLLPNGLTESETAATASVAGLAPLQSCEWTNCPTRVGDVCCNDRAAPAQAAPAPQAEPIGYMSPQQVPAIRDPQGDFGHYIPMRKTPAGSFTLALYTAAPAAPAAAAPKPASKEQIEQHLRTLTTDPAVLDALRAIAHPAPAVAATVQALTDAQITELSCDNDECKTYSDILSFARAIERAHGITAPSAPAGGEG